jgi:hypothetical protein
MGRAGENFEVRHGMHLPRRRTPDTARGECTAALLGAGMGIRRGADVHRVERHPTMEFHPMVLKRLADRSQRPVILRLPSRGDLHDEVLAFVGGVRRVLHDIDMNIL